MKLSELLADFEKRNNFSAVIEVFSDDTYAIVDFWNNKEIVQIEGIDELKKFLKEKQYQLSPSGRCYDPPREAIKEGEINGI